MQALWLHNIVTTGSKFVSKLIEGGQEQVEPHQMTMPELIEQARREWQDAQEYYNNFTDNDLIDHAAFRIQAAEKRYVYLMKKAREEGIVYSRYTM